MELHEEQVAAPPAQLEQPAEPAAPAPAVPEEPAAPAPEQIEQPVEEMAPVQQEHQQEHQQQETEAVDVPAEFQEQMQIDPVPSQPQEEEQAQQQQTPPPPAPIEEAPVVAEASVETATLLAEPVPVAEPIESAPVEQPVVADEHVPEIQEKPIEAPQLVEMASIPQIEETQAKLIAVEHQQEHQEQHQQENNLGLEANTLMQLASLTDQQVILPDGAQIVDNTGFHHHHADVQNLNAQIVDPSQQNAQVIVIDQTNLANLDQNGQVVVTDASNIIQDLSHGQQVVMVDANGGQTYSNLTDLSNVQQMVMVDQNQIETVVVMSGAASELQGLENGATILHQNLTAGGGGAADGSMVLENSVVDTSIMASTTLNMEEGDEEEEPNEQALKEMEESLAMSPGFSSTTFTMNGTNVSTHTFRKTEWDVKKLENYVRATYNDMQPIENMAPALMNDYLKSFFDYAKKSDGMDYEPESLIGFMNSFERYLKTKNYPESLLRSETFKDARNILKKKRELVRSIGKLIRTKTKDTCYLLQFHRNLLKEKGLLSRDNPDCLLAEIYLNNMIYFGEHLKEDKAWRGNLNLVWGDMVLERDSQNGLEYLTLATWAKKGSSRYAAAANTVANLSGVQASPASRSKGKKTGASPNLIVQIVDPNSPRVYARQPASWCPVEAYKNYRSRRPNNCLDRDSPFYLAPLFKSKHHSKVWYKALAMSCQRLDALFYCLFKKAGVDLTSLASMSQQQQQQAVAAAASIINNDPAAGQWKKDGHDEVQYNNGIKHADAQNAYHVGGNTFYAPGGANAQGHHHIVTTVPAQVQVQVQVQVVPPHLHQQTVVTNAGVAQAATLLV